MPNKVVAGYTQIPVVANDIMAVAHTRGVPGGTIDVTVTYLIRDDTNSVRATKSTATTTASYPLSGANALAACNTAEGT